jgi:hypothetical protein
MVTQPCHKTKHSSDYPYVVQAILSVEAIGIVTGNPVWEIEPFCGI